MFNSFVLCYASLFLSEVMTAAKPGLGISTESTIFGKISVALDDSATVHIEGSKDVATHFLFVDGSEIFSNGMEWIANIPEENREVKSRRDNGKYCLWNGKNWERLSEKEELL